MTLSEIKHQQMHELAQYRQSLYKNPKLTFLFLELTQRCNENCLHCGSSCVNNENRLRITEREKNIQTDELSLAQYKELLDQIAEDFDLNTLQLCVTGGEPLLRKDFFDIMWYAHKKGFKWGLTSNGTLITREVAKQLKITGMKTISISIDGLRDSHDSFRQSTGAYYRAMHGVSNLINEGGFEHIQITTVINHTNIHELEELYRILVDMDIDSWRVVGIEPIGRALKHPELLLTMEDQKYLLDFIRQKRMEDMPVTYACSHYLGDIYEKEVRDQYFICGSGIFVASVCYNGDIVGCLDMERIPEIVQGNVLTDRFSDVWYNKFKFFRRDFDLVDLNCIDCPSKEFCAGGSKHTFDYNLQQQRVCMKQLWEQ